MNTATVSLAVTPTVVSTFLSHYLNRKTLAHKPTAHLSYDQGLHLIRSFLTHASRHTVEELQAFTSQWVPHPQWVRVDHIEIPETDLLRAADLLAEQLGPDGIRQVGGKEWWQWRKPKSPLKAEWVEMKADYYERKKNPDAGNRVMLYVHGGGYYFGSVDEHRYQIQRHARKLKARALAPRYRLAPQFPFPCGLQDCLATYLYLITQQKPNTIILAGDSAGAGMVLAMMVILRDRGIPLPAGAVLISPWADLTHSFPSVAGDCPLDYIPSSGFHHKPSPAWPPPDEEELEVLKKEALAQKKKMQGMDVSSTEQSEIPTVKEVAEATHRLKFLIDGEDVEIKEQIQMYTTNDLLAHPLVSPIMQPTLGGLPPLLVMVGGGELLRDEQIYLAHKCANPSQYLPPEALMDEKARELVDRYKPTDVQLQVWDDMCHVGPTLSFTRPAKYMYRSVAQFSAWALARAQKIEVEILNDDTISVISSSGSSSSSSSSGSEDQPQQSNPSNKPRKPIHHHHATVGKAGDPLPPFHEHMIRQRISRHGAIHALPAATELPGCCMARELVGVVKVGTVRKWLEHKRRWDARFKQAHAGVHKKRLRDLAAGYEVFAAGDVPPPSALAGRRRLNYAAGRHEGKTAKGKKAARSLGLSLWALWGSKHDEAAVQRELLAVKAPELVAAGPGQGQGARHFSDLERQEREARLGAPVPSIAETSKTRAWRGLAGEGSGGDGNGDAASVPAGRDEEGLDLRPAGPVGDGDAEGAAERPQTAGLLSPDDAHDTGVSGKRVIIGGLATPFSLRKEPETASMITLASPMDRSSVRLSTADSSSFIAAPWGKASDDQAAAGLAEQDRNGDGDQGGLTPGLETPFMTPFLSPTSPAERPDLDRFVTAEEVTKVGGA
ncbi:Alpha/Beta hydrolase protein [Chaetomium tenue]|uniref:Alpha/Beta hydrolase protein n=1 Tax=Chaetomium tenue TaxID=1854479 RepID=A0ACB7PL95_9PEZI|nr:Alpha/Beta hydrolase protein [Chaetomium globosum]